MKIVVFDLYNFIHRARFSFQEGEHSITYSFYRSIKKEISNHEPDKVIFVSEGTPKSRNALFEDYKGTRERVKDDNFSRQRKDIINSISYLPVYLYKNEEHEADDVINYIAQTANENDQVTILSSDTDFIQLLKLKNVKLFNPVKKDYVKWDNNIDYVTYKSLKGDTSDNISGVTGVGKVKAEKLASSETELQKFLDGCSEEEKNQFILSKKLVQFMDTKDVEEKLKITKYNFEKDMLHKFFEERKFWSILNNKVWPDWKNIFEKIS